MQEFTSFLSKNHKKRTILPRNWKIIATEQIVADPKMFCALVAHSEGLVFDIFVILGFAALKTLCYKLFLDTFEWRFLKEVTQDTAKPDQTI